MGVNNLGECIRIRLVRMPRLKHGTDGSLVIGGRSPAGDGSGGRPGPSRCAKLSVVTAEPGHGLDDDAEIRRRLRADPPACALGWLVETLGDVRVIDVTAM